MKKTFAATTAECILTHTRESFDDEENAYRAAAGLTGLKRKARKHA